MTDDIQVGDTVRIIEDAWDHNVRGRLGTVLDCPNHPRVLSVWIPGRSGDNGRYDGGWAYTPSQVELVRSALKPSKALNDADGALTPATPSEAESGDSPDSQEGSRGEALAKGERMDEYGHPKHSFERIAAFWTAYLEGVARQQHDRWHLDHLPTLSGEDVGHMMQLLKISRTITDKGDDTLDDIDGYTACIRMLRSDTQ